MVGSPPQKQALKLTDNPGTMLRAFLKALAINGIRLKRAILTTGAKQYGVHLGPVKTPMEESDPWIEGPAFPPNFYYTQQRILHEEAEKQGYEWVVTYPNDVIGFARGNFMNLSTSLALYATICKELGGELEFPGSERFYQRFDSFTSAKLHAQFNLWAARKLEAANQAFNVVNGDVESWANMWPKLAKRFGCEVPEKQFERQHTEDEASVMELSEVTPYDEFASQNGLKGKVPRGKVENRIAMAKWSKRQDVKEAWERIAERDGLEKDAFEKATWSFLDFVLGRNYDIVISMSKARKLGWTGYEDTWTNLEETFDILEKEKIIPRASK
jgi:hypothetical protein